MTGELASCSAFLKQSVACSKYSNARAVSVVKKPCGSGNKSCQPRCVPGHHTPLWTQKTAAMVMQGH